MGRVLLYLVAFATALPVRIVTAEAPQPPTDAGYYIRDYTEITSQAAAGQPWWGMTFDLVVKLGLVIGLIYLTTWVLRTYVMGPKARGPLALGRAAGKIELLETTALGPNRTLYLVEVADRVLLLGGTPSGLTTLTEIREQDAIDLLRKKGPEEPPQPNFAEQLKSLTGHLPASPPSQFLHDKVGELRALAAQFRRTPVER